MASLLETTEARRKIWQDTKQKLPSYKHEVAWVDLDIEFKKSKKEYTAMVSVMDVDVFSLYQQLAKKTKTLLVSNLCYTNKGGGYKQGTPTDESELYLRTNYSKAMKLVNTQEYPVNAGKGLYVPNITALKNSKYKWLPDDSKFKLDSLAITLINNPSIVNSGQNGLNEYYENSRDKQQMLNYINTVVKFAVKHQYQSIILVNLGVRSNKHPVDDIIDIYRQVFKSSGISNVFIIMPKGDHHKGSDTKEARRIYNKYCRELDNTNKFETREDCQEPEEEDIEVSSDMIKKERRRLKKRSQNMKYVPTTEDDENFDEQVTKQTKPRNPVKPAEPSESSESEESSDESGDSNESEESGESSDESGDSSESGESDD